MASIASLSSWRGSALNERRTISVELPEFAIRAIQYRVDLTNEDAESEEERVSFNDVVEWFLLSPLSVKEMPHLEEAVPGFTGAFTKWLFDATYSLDE